MRLSKNRLLLWAVAALILVVILIMWSGFLRPTMPSKPADAAPQPQSPKSTSAQLTSPVQPQTASVKTLSAAAQPALLPQTQARVDQNPNQEGGAMLTPRQRVSDPDPSYVSVTQATGALQHDLQTACQAVIQPQFQSYTGSSAQCLEVWKSGDDGSIRPPSISHMSMLKGVIMPSLSPWNRNSCILQNLKNGIKELFE